MNKILLKSFMALLFIGVFTSLQAQADNNDTETDNHDVRIVIPNFAILDVEPETTTFISLEAEEPDEAGTALDFSGATNSALWLNYSSIVASGETRKVTVKLSEAVPLGLILKVTAAGTTGGKGDMGSAAGQITLDATEQDIITAIGSCYTEDGESKGRNLTYDLSADVDEYAEIISTTGTGTSVTVTYTIAAE